MSDEVFTSEELCKRLGITYRQLDYWCSKGYLGKKYRQPGSGQRRRFTETDVERAEQILYHLNQLHRLGVRGWRRTAEQLRADQS